MEKTQNQLHLLNNSRASKLCQVYNPDSYGFIILRMQFGIYLNIKS
jgi:hypothetical protein